MNIAVWYLRYSPTLDPSSSHAGPRETVAAGHLPDQPTLYYPPTGKAGRRLEKYQVHRTTLHHSAAGQAPLSRIPPSKSAYPIPPGRQPTLGCTVRRTTKTATSPTRPPEYREPGAGKIEAKDGLPSADRNNKATLLLTGPFRTAKSSAKDLTPLVLKLQYAKYRDALPAPRRNRLLRR